MEDLISGKLSKPTILKSPATRSHSSEVRQELCVWSVRKSPLGHNNKFVTSVFAGTGAISSAKQQVSGASVHLPRGHAHEPHAR